MACRFGSYDLKVRFHGSQLCNQVNSFHDRSDDHEYEYEPCHICDELDDPFTIWSWQTHSRKSMLLISCNVHYKSLQLETRKGCSNVRLLLVDGREVDFEHSHLIDKDVAELLVEGLIVDRQKLNQS